MSKCEETVIPNKTQGKNYRIACSECIGETRHKVLQSIDINGREIMDGFWSIFWQDKYQIIQCQGCDTISFRKFHTNSEDSNYDNEGNEIPIERVEIYPSRIAGRHKLNDSRILPHNVLQIYYETHVALCNKQPILAVIGIRALVETVCKEMSATGSNLEKKIDNLETLGILTNQNVELLHGLRILGNEAAHEVKVQDEQTLGLAMDVVEQLLNNVYIIPSKAASLPKR